MAIFGTSVDGDQNTPWHGRLPWPARGDVSSDTHVVSTLRVDAAGFVSIGAGP